jgi:hypothetical protein
VVYVDHYPESGVEIFKERADGSAVLALYNNKKTSIGPDGHEQIQADVLFLNQRVKNVEDVTKNFDVYWKKLAALARADLITRVHRSRSEDAGPHRANARLRLNIYFVLVFK